VADDALLKFALNYGTLFSEKELIGSLIHGLCNPS